MKILLINYTDAGGGAAMAAVRLVDALNKNGQYARLGVLKKCSNDPYVFKLPQKKKIINNSKKIEKFLTIISEKINKKIINILFTTTNGIKHTSNFHSKTDINWINNSEFDIVNLHWISGVICNKDIAKIKKPIVWTMHDSWPCCGAEHHPNITEGDIRWKEGYYRNNKPASTKGIDLCRKVWKQKKKCFGSKNIVFTAPSHWEQEILKSSYLFRKSRCELIPNIIDQKVFYPRDKIVTRKLLGIPTDKTIIGFGASYDIDNPHSMKGSYYLIDALQKLKNPENFFLVIFGPTSDSYTCNINIPFLAFGYIYNPNILACIYSLCDIVINPSFIENLPMICLESISCGVPVVAFDVGGISDIIVHKETGYLATPYKTEELALGIEWCVENIEQLPKKCVEKAKKDFDEEGTIKKYINIYNKAIKV